MQGLTVAATLAAARPLLFAPRDKQAEASAAHRRAYGASRSDLLAAVAAYDGATAARAAGGARAERAYCEERWVSSRTLQP